uniref:Bacterial bifunctional deaminase-reductase C-terminal domain-containing protein n=1 Tax=Cyclophora tenuis TaxID=216820 RepID=A0A7S1D192_CYCTE
MIREWKDDGTTCRRRPFVTLTYAQSLDGKIAIHQQSEEEKEEEEEEEENGAKQKGPSSNLVLSGPDSLLMTHGLRSIHDAILVGGSTLLVDNPRLSNRLWGSRQHQQQQQQHQPIPVVLDTNLQSVTKLGALRKAKNILVCCSHEAATNVDVSVDDDKNKFTAIPCNTTNDGTLDLRDVLLRLYERGIRSVMVEGGAQVLTSFVTTNNNDDDNDHHHHQPLVDCVCVTISPKLIGQANGIPSIHNIPSIAHPYVNLANNDNGGRFISLGDDCVFLCRQQQ